MSGDPPIYQPIASTPAPQFGSLIPPIYQPISSSPAPDYGSIVNTNATPPKLPTEPTKLTRQPTNLFCEHCNAYRMSKVRNKFGWGNVCVTLGGCIVLSLIIPIMLIPFLLIPICMYQFMDTIHECSVCGNYLDTKYFCCRCLMCKK